MFSQSKMLGSHGSLQDEDGEDELKADPPENHPPGQVGPIDGKGPGQKAQKNHPQEGAKPRKKGRIQTPFPLLPEVGLDRLLRRAPHQPAARRRPQQRPAGSEEPRVVRSVSREAARAPTPSRMAATAQRATEGRDGRFMSGSLRHPRISLGPTSLPDCSGKRRSNMIGSPPPYHHPPPLRSLLFT